MIKIKAKNLQVGQEFKQRISQRKYRKVTAIRTLLKHDHIPPVGRKVLIMYDGCCQWAPLEDTEVLI